MHKGYHWEQYPQHYALAIIAISSLVRFFFVLSGQLNLVQDEAQYWDWSRNLQLSYYSKGPLISWSIHFWTNIFGHTELGVRFGALLNSALIQLILFFSVARLARQPLLGLYALLIANTTPLFMASGILMTTDSPLLLCWVICLFCLYAASQPHAKRKNNNASHLLAWCVFSIALALGILAKYSMLVIPAIGLLFAWLLQRHKLLPRNFIAALCISSSIGLALGLAPILIWNNNNDWVSFRHVSTLAGFGAQKVAQSLIQYKYFPEYIASQIGLLLPWWFIFMLVGAWRALRQSMSKSTPAHSSFEATNLRLACLCTCAFWPLWAFFVLWSLHTRVYPNWAAASYAAGIILAAQAVHDCLHKHSTATAQTKKCPLQHRLIPLWLALSLLLAIAIHCQSLLPIPAQYNPAARLKGWEDLGQKIEQLRQTMPNPDTVFFFSNAYDVTAQMAFYIPGQPRTYCADLGRRMNQYDLWEQPEANKQKWDAIFVHRTPIKKMNPLFESMFARWDIQNYQSIHRGQAGRAFGIALMYDYTGLWPKTSQGQY